MMCGLGSGRRLRKPSRGIETVRLLAPRSDELAGGGHSREGAWLALRAFGLNKRSPFQSQETPLSAREERPNFRHFVPARNSLQLRSVSFAALTLAALERMAVPPTTAPFGGQAGGRG